MYATYYLKLYATETENRIILQLLGVLILCYFDHINNDL